MRRLAPFAIALALLTGPLAATPTQADLRDERDVERVLARLSEGSESQARASAARWLASHGPRAVVVPRLLDALERELSPEVLGPLTTAIARRAGPEHDARLIRITPSVRSPFRGMLVVAIAQLGTEASDAFLAQELAALGAVEIEVATPGLAQGGSSSTGQRVSLLALARPRGEHIAPLLLREASPPRLAPLEALVQLAHEEARSLYVSLLDDPALFPLALDGLAALGPHPVTAEALRRRAEGSLSPRFVAAFYAAEPSATELETWRSSGPTEVQHALRNLFIRREPSRLSEQDILPHAQEDEASWAASFAAPQPAAQRAYQLLMQSEAVPPPMRQAAFDAWLSLAEEDPTLCERRAPRLEGTAALVAAARHARVCHVPFTIEAQLDEGTTLYFRALAGEDVRGALRSTWQTHEEDTALRMDLAHAFWVSREGDDFLREAWERETSDDLRDVLALALQRHRIEVNAGVLATRLAAPRSRFSSLLVAGAQPSLSLLTRPRILEALRDEEPRIRAAALLSLAPFEDGTALSPWACAALEGSEAERAAALRVLPIDAVCLREAERVDPSLRQRAARTAPRDVVVQLEGAGRPRLLFVGQDGTLGMAHPTRCGVVVFPEVRAAMRVVPALW